MELALKDVRFWHKADIADFAMFFDPAFRDDKPGYASKAVE
jgi:hypothetical protein